MNRELRTSLIDWEHRELPLCVQANLLGLNRTSLYYNPVPITAEEIILKHRIDEIYTTWPFYGSRRITAQLKREGFGVNRKAIQRNMEEMGIAGICPGPNLSKRLLKEQIYPYLLRNLRILYPNQVWGIDITYIRLKNGWLYLVAILDWFSRYVVSWELDQTLEELFVLEAIQKGFQMAKPEIFNSDQGSHFTSHQYTNLLKTQGIAISMDGKGRALDNIFIERFWRSIKYEEVYLKSYENPREARQNISQYIEFYNNKRVHQSLDYKTPAEYYWKGKAKKEKHTPG